ncbi:MAG TPA: hypothetical protein VI793_09375 [Anaerolineales bacterium]|nr:hypothetical protein [Anaerolineales bacterium]
MSTEPTMSDVTSDDKLWALLTYLLSPIAPIVIFLLADKKDRPFIKAHNVQALILGIITVALGSITFGCLGLVGWLYQLYCGFQAYKGKMVTIPLITNFVKNQGWA